MSLVRWNPFDEFDNLFAGFPQIGPNASSARRVTDWLPPVDITETDDSYHIDLEVPAVAREDIKVSVNDGLLTVSGERKSEERENGKAHRVERYYGKFQRTFRLPENVSEDSIKATSANGILKLEIAKTKPADPKLIEVEVH
jgi:HSP20 family protein